MLKKKESVFSGSYGIAASRLKGYSLPNPKVTATQLISWASGGIESTRNGLSFLSHHLKPAERLTPLGTLHNLK